eukprot:7380002-Prymnesium_polylepis.1
MANVLGRNSSALPKAVGTMIVAVMRQASANNVSEVAEPRAVSWLLLALGGVIKEELRACAIVVIAEIRSGHRSRTKIALN